MSSNTINGDDLHHQKALQIKQDDKFFTRLLSKETSMANSSCRVYYGGASGSVPFIWESHPGTPKHPSSDTAIPRLTPPPSYYSSLKSKSKQKKGTLLSSMFPSFIKKNQASPSSTYSSSRSSTTSSSSSLSSWSSLYHDSGSSSPSVKSSLNRKLFHRQMSYFSCSRSPVHDYNMDDDDDDDDDKHEDERLRSPTSTLCFGVKPRNLNGFKGCQSMINMKKALISIVSHGN